MKKLMKELIPNYARIPLLIVVIYNSLVYWGGREIAKGFYHYDLTTGLDRSIPLMPWMILIYIGCYLFWIANYILAAREEKTQAYKFVLADLLAKTVCFFLFVFFPTTMQRPEMVGNGFFEQAMSLLYKSDAADNLFPSIHCLVSWLCVIGIRKSNRIPKWYVYLSVVMAFSVFISTLTVKQHVIVDVIVGFLLAEVSYFCAGKIVEWKFEKHKIEVSAVENQLDLD